MNRTASFSVVALAAALIAVAPPTSAAGLDPVQPVVLAEALDGDRLDVFLAWPGGPGTDDGTQELDESWLQSVSLTLLADADARGLGVRSVLPWAIDPDDPAATWQPLVALLPPITPPPKRPHELSSTGLRAGPVVSQAIDAPGQTEGFLSGRVVYVSQGHGFYWSPVLGRWATQRGNTHGIVEDLVNAEAINHYLVAYLRNAGATVFTVREHDLQSSMVVVDAESGGSLSVEGQGAYEETGAWQDSVQAGFLAGASPYESGTNPFSLGHNRVIEGVQGEATAWAKWTPHIPEAGAYAVYVSYSQDASRVPDAHFVVRHAGGETQLRVDQQRHGRTWVELGTFRFEAGQDPSTGSVTLLNDTLSEEGGWVSADAVRFGGGMGATLRGDGQGVADGPTSGRPRWEECSRYYAQYSGAPPSVYDYSAADNKDDVSTRARYAAWQNEVGEDAVFVSWHTNAPNPGRGTSTYVYGPNPPDGSYQFSGVAGSDALAEALHGRIVADIRATFDPDWKDRGIRSAYFGELNPSHNAEMPSALVEVAFHDTAADAAFIVQPRFRQVVARAYARGIVDYFAARDDEPAIYTPEPPRQLVVRSSGPGEVTVSWSPPSQEEAPSGAETPTGYVVYRSSDGRAFDQGTPTDGASTSLAFDDATPGEPVYVRVTARNAGGESFPSPTLAASATCEGEAPSALLVHGFYRLDAASLPVDDLSPWGLGQVTRLRQREVNTYDYLVSHAQSLATAGMAFDSAEATAIEAGVAPLEPYSLVDWQLGEESTVDETLSLGEQAALRDWLHQGPPRTLVVTASELAWDLETKGSEDDASFLHDWLGVTAGADDAETYGATVVPGALGGALDGLGALAFDDGSLGIYDVDSPDVLIPVEAAETWLEYEAGVSAGVRFPLPAGATVFTMGFPFEALVEPDERAMLMTAWADAAGLEPQEACVPGDGEDTAVAEPRDATGDAANEIYGDAKATHRATFTRLHDVQRTDGCSQGIAGSPTWPLAALLMLVGWAQIRPQRRRRP